MLPTFTEPPNIVFGVTSVRDPVNLHVFELDRVPTVIQRGLEGWGVKE